MTLAAIALAAEKKKKKKLSRDRIWHYYSMKPYTEMATTTFVLDKNRTEKINFPI